MGAISRFQPVAARELLRRQRDLRRWIGRQVAEARLDAGVGPGALAECASITRGYLWKVEQGAAHVSIDTLTALSGCLGRDLGIRLFPTTGPRLHDRFQAPMVEALLRLCHPSWTGRPEVAVTAARGVIDVVLIRAGEHATVACECHSELRRLELVMRRAAEKAEALGPQFDDGAPASSLLLLRSTESTRAIARSYAATLSAAFPARASDAFAALTSRASWPGPSILWADVMGGRASILERPPRGVRVGR